MANTISVDDTKNWQNFRAKLNAYLASIGFLDTANTWTQPQTIKGASTNDNAPAGYVGEYLEGEVPSGSPVALTSNTIANVVTLALSAGDWDVWGVIGFIVGSGDTMSSPTAWIRTTSATAPTAPNKGAMFAMVNNLAGPNTNIFPVGLRRLSLAAPATAYLSAVTFHAGGTVGAFGFIGARRIR